MRHRVAGKKLNRHFNERSRLYTQLLTAIIDHRKITTTQAKAQAIRPEIEKLISMARHAPTQADIDAAPDVERDAKRHQRAEVFRRALMELGGSKRAAHRLLEVAPDYATRTGGYVRLTKIGPRKGDAAEMVVIELV
ncbi:MAG: 50S ribosomal protein L17 [Chloroflexota bacterium]|jgi:large subunit ribosomal protein L17|nr:50S ribosomal protein L17 [Chloroflexota bacterium]